MKFKVNDEVIVIAGSDKGKIGKILKIDAKNNKVTIKDVNVVTKHVKPTQQKTDGEIKQFEAPINASNVAFLVKKATKDQPAQYSKLKFEVKGDKKVRIVKKTGKVA